MHPRSQTLPRRLISRTGPNCEFEECAKPSIAQVDTSDWQTYRNEEYGFEVRYPETLEPLEEWAYIYNSCPFGDCPAEEQSFNSLLDICFAPTIRRKFSCEMELYVTDDINKFVIVESVKDFLGLRQPLGTDTLTRVSIGDTMGTGIVTVQKNNVHIKNVFTRKNDLVYLFGMLLDISEQYPNEVLSRKIKLFNQILSTFRLVEHKKKSLQDNSDALPRPVINLIYNNTTYKGALGSGCWPIGDGEEGSLCWDTALPRSDHTIEILRRDHLVVDFVGSDPPLAWESTLRAAQDEKLVDADIPQRADNKIFFDYPPDTYILLVNGSWKEGGVSYGFSVHVHNRELGTFDPAIYEDGILSVKYNARNAVTSPEAALAALPPDIQQKVERVMSTFTAHVSESLQGGT